jgi:mRNA interferase MazF
MEVVSRQPRLDEVWLVSLDLTRGSEIKKTRPCLVVSPDEMNQHLRTVIVVPMTTADRPYPTRVGLTFQGKSGQVALDQIRAVDRDRLVQRLGTISSRTAQSVSAVLVEMFGRQA